MKNDCRLLPHIKENVYGLSPSDAQILGWELIKFDIPKLWNVSTGKGVTIGVIDTGCDLEHLDLKANLVEGKNFVETNKDPMDDNGHGTHVAGTICGQNNSLGIVGISPDAKVMPLKALDKNGQGSSYNISKAINYGSKYCDFLCMSLGSSSNSKKIHEAIKKAKANGTIVFCAAGNAGENQPIMYPAKLKETIAVGAIDKNLARTPFTCVGEELDILSPGHDILSCVPHNTYALMSGTSMATPFIVGCAALLKSANPKMSQSDIIKIFQECSISIKNKQHQEKKYQGYGILFLNPKDIKNFS